MTVSTSPLFLGVAVIFYFLSFWFCKPNYEEESQTAQQPKEMNESSGEIHTETVL